MLFRADLGNARNINMFVAGKFLFPKGYQFIGKALQVVHFGTDALAAPLINIVQQIGGGFQLKNLHPVHLGIIAQAT